MNETIKTLMERRSVRAYKPEQITEAALTAILEAGLMAPSAMGKQSAVLVAVQDADTLKLLEQLNRTIAGRENDQFYGAPTAVVVLADPAATNADNADRDGSLAMGNLMNAAWSLGVGSCWINRAKETFQRPEGKALLEKWGLPTDLLGVGICILGYPEGDIPAPRPRREGRVVRA